MRNSNLSLFNKFVCHLTFISLCCFALASHAKEMYSNTTQATITTNFGIIELDLFKDRVPVTVANFIRYANEGFYNNTIFHRVIPNFMVQGGGFDQKMRRKPVSSPIKNEANSLIPNLRGTIAMARTNDPHSATSQFFINVKDNMQLNKSGHNAGYAVFGKVTKGLEIADKISKVATKSDGYMRDIPVDTIIIQSITITEPSSEPESPAPTAKQ
ncbi:MULTISPECIES: peptidylprolyl isomerase [unclassified Oleiphilus]|jgi:cyclophilin family peptidyl-prolyl cis-trans isomerase